MRNILDTENIMNKVKELDALKSMFVEFDLIETEIKAAFQEIRSTEPILYKTARKYASSSLDSLVDHILGIDSVLEWELEDGTVLFVAIDWTDNPDMLATKRDRMKSRKHAYDAISIDVCLAVRLCNRMPFPERRIEQVKLGYSLISHIGEKVEAMKEAGKYAGYLEINMKELM